MAAAAAGDEDEVGGVTTEDNGLYAGTAPCYEPLITRQPITHMEGT